MTTKLLPPAPADEEYRLPDCEARWAATLALMTGHAQACCEAHRQGMARKIAAHLHELGACEGLSFHFQALLASLHGRWVALAAPAAELATGLPTRAQAAAWLPLPETVQ